MTKLFKWVAAAACALPLAAMAVDPVAVWDGNFSSSELTKFTGYELVDWNETHGENNSSVTIDRANHGLMFNAESAMPGMTILVRYSNLTAGSSKKVLFTSCVASSHSGYRTGVRLGTDGKINGMWSSADYGTASGSVPESGVMAFTYSTAGTYLYAAEKGTERLVQVWGNSDLKSSQDTAIYGGSAGGFCDGSSISGFSAAAGMTIEAIAVFNSVVSLAEMQEYLWPTEAAVVVSRTIAADATVNWVDAAWTVGETSDQTFTPSADALYNATITVGGDCTIVMPETIGAFNRRNIKFVLDSGVQSATVTLKYQGTLPEAGSSVVLNPFGDALVVPTSGVTLVPEYNGDTTGYIVSASGLALTIVKGANYEGTIAADTNWSDIKPAGWANAIAGDQPSITVNYEGTEPVTLTFDETVTAGSLTLTGNIVVEATAAATFGTVTAGAGSVVEMANMTITTQAGAGSYRYRSNYPSTVPNQSLTYEYVGGADSGSAGAVTLNGMRGTVKTTGFMNISGYYPLNTAAKLDVVSGTTTLTAGGQAICGYITIREGATLVNTSTDSLAYSSYNSIIDIYGTLDMGTSRWTVWSGATFNFRGGEMIGVGEGNNGALDFMGTCNVYAYADSTISGNVKFRNALSNLTIDDGVTLTISGETKPGYNGGGITKKGAGTLKFTSDPYVPGGIVVEAGTLAFDTESDVDPVVTYTAAVLKDANMDYVSQSNWKGTVVISALEAGTTATQVALNKTGNENSYLTLSGITGNAWCAGSDYTVQPAITLAGNVNFENGSSKKTVTFRKIAAGTGNLSLKSWSTCTGITYGFTTLDADNYSGTIQLDGSVLTFNVGDILKANAQPSNETPILPLTVANNATVNLANATVNGAPANLALKADGIYLIPTVTITVPVVANTTITVSVGGETVAPATQGESSNTYSVADGATVTVTYNSEGYEVTGGTFEFTATEGYTVDASEVVTTQYVAYVVFQQESGESFIDVTNYYTTVAAAIDASKAMRKTVVLVAQPDEADTYNMSAGDVVNIKKGEFTFDGIVFPEGPQYNNTTTETAGVTQYKCAVYTATVQYPGQEPVSMTGQLIQILGGLYSGYVPAYAGTVVTVLDGSDATLGDAMPEVFTYDSEAHTYTLKTMVASINTGAVDIYYPTISNAFEAVVSGQTIKVLCDNTSYVRSVRVKEGTTVTLDLNGFTVTGPSGDNPMFWLEDNSNFVVTDTTEDKAGKLVSEASKVVWSSNRCTFTLTAGTLESGNMPIYIYEASAQSVPSDTRVVNVNGGKLICKSANGGDACIVNTPGRVYVTGGVIESTVRGIRAVISEISGGTVKVGNSVFYNDDSFQVVTGGTFNKDVSKYCSEGYAAFVDTPGYWTVREVYAEGQEVRLYGTNVTITASQATWLKACGDKATVSNKIENLTFDQFYNDYLLNLDVTGEFSYDFKVSDINVAGEDVTLTVSLTRTGALANKINGTVALTGTDELGKTFATISEAVVTDDDFSDNGSTTTITLKTGDAKFFQPVIK